MIYYSGDGRSYIRTIQTPDEAKREPTITFAELRDVCDLIAHKKWPNGQFGDDECCAWSIIRRELGINY